MPDEQIFNALMLPNFALNAFFEDYPDYKETNDTALTERFPFFYVRRALQKSDSETLITAFFKTDLDAAMLKKILPQLEQGEKERIKEIFTANNSDYDYSQPLNPSCPLSRA